VRLIKPLLAIDQAEDELMNEQMLVRRSRAQAIAMSIRRVQYMTFIMSVMFLGIIFSILIAAVLTIQTGGIAYELDVWHRPLATSLHVIIIFMISMNLIVAIYIRYSVTSAALNSEGRQDRTPPQEPQPPQPAPPMISKTLEMGSSNPISAHIAGD